MHLVGILFPHINDDARSKSHQIYTFFPIRIKGVFNKPGVQGKPIPRCYHFIFRRKHKHGRKWKQFWKKRTSL